MLYFRFPFVLTLLTATIMYAPFLLIADIEGRVAAWLASVLIWLYAGFVFYLQVRWAYQLITRKTRSSTQSWHDLVDFGDFWIVIYQVWAAIGFTLWLLDSSPSKTDFFLNVDAGASKYTIYVANFLAATVFGFNGLGIETLKLSTQTVLPALWAIFTSVAGVIYLGFFLGIVAQNLQYLGTEEAPAFMSEYMTMNVVPRIYSNMRHKRK